MLKLPTLMRFLEIKIKMITFIKTQRGARKLIFQEYSYNKVKDGPDGKTYWRCDEIPLKYGGTATTDRNNSVFLGQPHNHAPSPTKIAVKRVNSTIKENAVTSPNTPRDLVNSSLEGISDGVKIHLPELKKLQKTVSRKRKNVGAICLVPHSLVEIDIPPRLRRTKTATQENFILSDSGTEDANHIIIFGCTTDVNRLIQCDTWVVDGTFKSAPNLWYQLWVIHGVFFNKTVPFIFAFLPSKSEVIYERALTTVLAKIDAIRPAAELS
ncbi:hypothetical protein TcasGA2_TC011266 [Tribolium castaneum]|uniref:FLYWCH-type domain-containing protein n=1 Tax=Tribolium castaneum TaxID=7070 RepID=D6X3M8_TRICA|nr:hypothetical protein TcasGA2_TC011266 [Tribolium castaneum]